MPNKTRIAEVPDEYLREIGMVVVSWNRLENLLHHVLVLALQDDFAKDARALSIFVHMAFPQKLDTLKTMLRISQSNEGQIFIDYQENIYPLLKTCQEKRNNILHQSWSMDNGTVQRFDIKARGTFKATRMDVPLADLIDASSLMADTHQTMFTLLALPLSPKVDPQ